MAPCLGPQPQAWPGLDRDTPPPRPHGWLLLSAQCSLVLFPSIPLSRCSCPSSHLQPPQIILGCLFVSLFFFRFSASLASFFPSFFLALSPSGLVPLLASLYLPLSLTFYWLLSLSLDFSASVCVCVCVSFFSFLSISSSDIFLLLPSLLPQTLHYLPLQRPPAPGLINLHNRRAQSSSR